MLVRVFVGLGKFLIDHLRYLAVYAVGALVVSVVPYVLPAKPEVGLAVFHALAVLSLPFIIVPVPRWLTKLTLWEMKELSQRRSLFPPEVEMPKKVHFMDELQKQNFALVVIRVVYTVGTTLVFLDALDPWLYSYQTQIVVPDNVNWLRTVQVGMFMYLTGIAILGFCAINVLVTVRLFHFVIRGRTSEYYEIVVRKNLAVGLMYAVLLLCVFAVTSSVAARIVGIVIG